MTNLHVIPGYVDELSTAHDDISSAVQIASAASAGQAASMWNTHGVVCAASNTVMHMVESARESACTAIESMSTDLSERLTSAAKQYEECDEALQRLLDRQVQAHWIVKGSR